MEFLAKVRNVVDNNLKKVMGVVAGSSYALGAVSQYLTEFVDKLAK